jgi:hypothetical protein
MARWRGSLQGLSPSRSQKRIARARTFSALGIFRIDRLSRFWSMTSRRVTPLRCDSATPGFHNLTPFGSN